MLFASLKSKLKSNKFTFRKPAILDASPLADFEKTKTKEQERKTKK